MDNIQNKSGCLNPNSFLTLYFKKYFELFPSFLIIMPILSTLRIGFNPYLNKFGRLYAWLPTFLATAAYILSNYFQKKRPFDGACALELFTEYGTPMPELVWTLSSYWVEIFFEYEMIDDPVTVRCGRVLGYVLSIPLITILSQYVSLGFIDQIFFSFLLSILTLPLIWATNSFYNDFYR